MSGSSAIPDEKRSTTGSPRIIPWEAATLAGPFTTTQAPDTLSASHYVTINPTLPGGVTSYDVLKTSTPIAPSGACACAVATAVSPGTVTNDQSNSTSAYTVNPININALGMTIANEVQSAGVSHLILRQNGVFVADLSSAVSGSYLPLAGGTMTGKLNTVASGTGSAGFNLPPGTPPTSPVNGDCWTTSSGLFCQIAGTTVGPYGTGSGYALLSANNIFVGDQTITGNLSVSGAITQTGGGPTQWSGNAQTSAVTVPSGSDFSIFVNSSDQFACQLSTALGGDRAWQAGVSQILPPTAISNAQGHYVLRLGSGPRPIFLHGFCPGAVYNSTNGIALQGLGASTAAAGTCSQGGGGGGTQVNYGVVITHACVMQNLYVNVATASSTAGDGVISVNDGATGEPLTCTLGTATSCHDTTDTFAAAAGDMIWVAGLQTQLQFKPFRFRWTVCDFAMKRFTHLALLLTLSLSLCAQTVSTGSGSYSGAAVRLTASCLQTYQAAYLSWTQATDPNVVTNNVYRGTQSGGPYTEIYESSAPITSYTDTPSAGTYYYVVTAVSNGGGPPWPQTDWSSSTAFFSRQVICPTVGNAGSYSFYSLASGTSGGTEPTWPQTAGATTSADGTISGWENGANVCTTESLMSNEASATTR